MTIMENVRRKLRSAVESHVLQVRTNRHPPPDSPSMRPLTAPAPLARNCWLTSGRGYGVEASSGSPAPGSSASVAAAITLRSAFDSART